MPKNSFLRAIFPGIKYSVSPIEKPVKGNVKIGKVIPVYKTMIQGKESVRLDFSHLLRFAPLNVPVMEGYRVDFDVFKVPVSSIAYSTRHERDIMDFHNLALNDGTNPNPFSALITDVDAYNGKFKGKVSDFFRKHTLADYLNFPTFKRFREQIRDWLATTPLFDGPFTGRVSGAMDLPTTLLARLLLNHPCLVNADSGSLMNVYLNVCFYTGPAPEDFTSSYGGDAYATYSTEEEVGFADFGISRLFSLFRYIVEHYPLVRDYYSIPAVGFLYNLTVADVEAIIEGLLVTWEAAFENGTLDFNYLDVLYKFYKIDAQTVFSDWFEEIFGILLFNDNLKHINYTVLDDNTHRNTSSQ